MTEVLMPQPSVTPDGRVIMKAGVRNAPLPVAALPSFMTRFMNFVTPPPESYDVDANNPKIDCPMYDNDRWNNCVIAARAHHSRRLFLVANRILLNILADPDVDQEYIAENQAENNGQFDDSQGLIFTDSLSRWTQGWRAAGHDIKLANYTAIQLSVQSIKKSIYTSTGVEIIIFLPSNYNIRPNYGLNVTWSDTSTGLNDPGFDHCMLLIAYDSRTVTGITWATKQVMTWDFLMKKVKSAVVVSL